MPIAAISPCQLLLGPAPKGSWLSFVLLRSRTIGTLLANAIPKSTARGFSALAPSRAAYASIDRLNPLPTRVVPLGPSHHVAFTAPCADTFETPLGAIQLDAEAMNAFKTPLRPSPAASQRLSIEQPT